MPVQTKGVVIWIAVIGLLLVIAFVGSEIRKLDSNDHSNKPYLAMEKLKSNTDIQLVDAITVCKEMVSSVDNLVTRDRGYLESESIPKEFLELGANPEYVRVTERGCDIHLHKGIGKGIGYYIDAREWSMSWYNHYQSWDSHKIVIGTTPQKRGI